MNESWKIAGWSRCVWLGWLLSVVAFIEAFGWGGTGYSAIVDFVQISSPAGILLQTNYLETPTSVSTLGAPASSGGYRFTHWTIAGVRYNDSLGRSENPVTFTLFEPTIAVANYVAETVDADGDGMPDWYELEYFGNLVQDGNSDTDGDGFTLSQEYALGYHPLVKDEIVLGGVVHIRSSMVALNLDLSPVCTIVSSPPGFVGITNTVVAGAVVTTPDLRGQSVGGYRFGYWELEGMRQQDAYGLALGSASFPVYRNTVATAHYFAEGQDSDGDGVPDWYQWQYYDSLAAGAGSDTDADGFTLAQEMAQGTMPTFKDEFLPGGISRVRSTVVGLKLDLSPNYQIVSDPPGFVTVSNTVVAGTVVGTPDVWGQSVGGYRFAYWEWEGLRQQDAYGVALGSFSFPVYSNTVATAHYLPEGLDSDGDGVPDWYRWQYYGDLAAAASSDTDGDGYSLAQEMAQGTMPTFKDEFLPGGISRARAASSTLMDLQPFERLQYLLVDGVVSNFFTTAGGVGGGSFGTDAAPALGDWDGDGDLDLFVSSASGWLRVYENAGSRHTMNLSERTGNFQDLRTALTGMGTSAMALGDWSGDGRADLVVGGVGGTVNLMPSTGGFSAPQTVDLTRTLASGSSSAIPALADLNGDGRQDLLLLLANGTVEVYTNTGNSNEPFVAPPAFLNFLGQAVPQATGLAMADINFDGRLDILVADVAGRIWEFRNDGGGFTLMGKTWGGAGVGFAHRLVITSGDIDGDGDPDVIGGIAEGGLLALRDPRYAIPTNVRAHGGASSVLLEWDPDVQSRIAGYHVYRSVADTNTFSLLNTNRAVVPRYGDALPVEGSSNYYRVTAVSGVVYPGNSLPQYVESRPSEIVGAAVGGVTLLLSDYFGKPGGATVLQINTPLASGISGTGLEIRISYDPALMKPLAQADPTQQSVEKTALTHDLVMVDNGATATGELVITCSGGGVINGKGNLFDVNFKVEPTALPGSKGTNVIVSATLQNAGGHALVVNCASKAVMGVAAGYFPGDVNGDGVLTEADVELALSLSVGQRTPTASEIAAGDLNGNGVIDSADGTMILRLVKGLPVNSG